MAHEDAVFLDFVFKHAADIFDGFGGVYVGICAGDERLLPTACAIGNASASCILAYRGRNGHDALCTSIRKIRFILRFRNLLG